MELEDQNSAFKFYIMLSIIIYIGIGIFGYFYMTVIIINIISLCVISINYMEKSNPQYFSIFIMICVGLVDLWYLTKAILNIGLYKMVVIIGLIFLLFKFGYNKLMEKKNLLAKNRYRVNDH